MTEHMTHLFQRAAFRAGRQAARTGIPLHESPFRQGPLGRFERDWRHGWSAHVGQLVERHEHLSCMDIQEIQP